MTRHWSWLVVLAALLALAGCSDDDENSPPTVVFLFPDDGFVYDGSTSGVELLVEDDGNVPLVEVLLDGAVVSSLTEAPWETLLPVGRWADGLPHEIVAIATDAEGAEGSAGPITVTFDPSLQTIPQIVAAAPSPDDQARLRVEWLAFPEAELYRYEVARTDGFSAIIASGETTDHMVDLPPLDATLLYIRVQADVTGVATEWSRTFRYDGTEGWRIRYDLANRQQGTAIFTAADGSLRLLSHAVREARVARADVQLLHVDPEGQLVATHDLLGADYQPTSHLQTADDTLLLGGVRTDGTGFLAAFSIDGDPLWSLSPGEFEPTALWADTVGAIRVAGADVREMARGGVIRSLDSASGAMSDLVTFELESGRQVLVGWPRPDGGWVVGGQLPDLGDEDYAGIFARGLLADGSTDWNLRLGSAHRWLLRGHGTDGQGIYIMSGIAYRSNPSSRYAFMANFDHRGRLRWQLGETRWHFYGQVEPTLDGRWTAVGARRRYVTDQTWLYDTALRGLSEAGQPLWEIQHKLGEESHGWALAPHPDGGWYVTGFTTADRNEYDLDLLRVDDLGELE